MRNVMRWIGTLAALATALGSFAFFLLYMARWEWGRALVAGIVFVAAEVALGFVAILRRLDRMGGDPREEHARRAAPVHRQPLERFPWLAATRDQRGVFIPLLLGGGVLVSAVTWAIEKVSSVSGSSGDAESFEEFAFPDRSLVPSDTEVRVRGLGRHDDDQLHALLGPFSSDPSR